MGDAVPASGKSPDTINILWLDWRDGDHASMRVFAELQVTILRIQLSLEAAEVARVTADLRHLVALRRARNSRR